jgi:collagen type III alpha
MKGADKNGDGKLSREEAPQPLKDNFERLDTNRDGQIDEAEVRQFLGVRRDGDRPPGDRPRDGDRPPPPRGEGDRPARD